MGPSRNRTELNVKILEMNGNLNYNTIEALNHDLISKGCDFQVRYIEHGYPYFSTYFEIQNIADCNISKSKRKFKSDMHGTNTKSNITYRLYEVNQKNGNKQKRIIILQAIRKGIVIASCIITLIFGIFGFSSVAEANDFNQPSESIEQVNRESKQCWEQALRENDTDFNKDVVNASLRQMRLDELNQDLQQQKQQKSDIALELRGGDYPLASPSKFGITDPSFKVDPMARSHKSGPGARGRALGRTAAQNRAAQRKSGGIRGVDAYTTSHQGFCKYHGSKMQSCLTRKATQTPFDNPGDNPGSPPSAPGQGPGKLNSPLAGSEFRGGPSFFKGIFKYDSNFSANKIDFKDQKIMGHMFDGHAKKALNIQGNKNKQTLQQMQDKLVQFIEEPDTICLQGSYNYRRPAYLFAKSEEQSSENNLIFAVDAKTNRPITVINATKFQRLKLDRPDHNLGMDRRPQKEGCDDNEQVFGHMVLRLRGPQ